MSRRKTSRSNLPTERKPTGAEERSRRSRRSRTVVDRLTRFSHLVLMKFVSYPPTAMQDGHNPSHVRANNGSRGHAKPQYVKPQYLVPGSAWLGNPGQARLIVISLTLAAMAMFGASCYRSKPTIDVLLWTWSQGQRLEALRELADRFDRVQESVDVRLEPWPARAEGAGQVSGLRDLLEGRSEAGNVPTLLEIPDIALASFVEKGLARDLSGRSAENLGVRFEDFHAWDMPGKLMQSEGVAALPLYREAPLVVWKRDAEVNQAWDSEGYEGLVKIAVLRGEKGLRPLAAAADHRLVLSLLRSSGSNKLRSDQVEKRLRFCLDLLGGRALTSDAEGERQAFEDMFRGEALATWVWSGTLADRLDVSEELEVARAPARTRGTWLVVNSGAGWRERQAAFRLARWVTEPQQTAFLAARFWTVPSRRSAVASVQYRDSAGPRSWRDAVAANGGEPRGVPAEARFMELMVDELEPALVHGNIGDLLVGRLQQELPPTDE